MRVPWIVVTFGGCVRWFRFHRAWTRAIICTRLTRALTVRVPLEHVCDCTWAASRTSFLGCDWSKRGYTFFYSTFYTSVGSMEWDGGFGCLYSTFYTSEGSMERERGFSHVSRHCNRGRPWPLDTITDISWRSCAFLFSNSAFWETGEGSQMVLPCCLELRSRISVPHFMCRYPSPQDARCVQWYTPDQCRWAGGCLLASRASHHTMWSSVSRLSASRVV